MNRYILLAADDYRVFGWRAYQRDFETLHDALEYVHENYHPGGKYWWEIVDLNIREVVGESK